MSEQLMTPAEIERATVERCASLADSLYAEAREDEITQAIRAAAEIGKAMKEAGK